MILYLPFWFSTIVNYLNETPHNTHIFTSSNQEIDFYNFQVVVTDRPTATGPELYLYVVMGYSTYSFLPTDHPPPPHSVTASDQLKRS